MKKRILIVDDEPAFTRLVRMHLEYTGRYTVQEENNALQAMAAAKVFQPDLILLDIMMPEMDGGELASQFVFNPDFHHVPIIFLTGIVSAEEIGNQSWGQLGGRVYLAKPVQWDNLIECIEQKLNTSETVAI